MQGMVQDFRGLGRDFLLTPEEDETIVEYIGYCSKQNFPLKRQDLHAMIPLRPNIESPHIFVPLPQK